MEMFNIRRPQTAPPLHRESMEIYISDDRSASTMTLNTRYHPVQDHQSASSDNESNAEDSDTTLQTGSSDSHEPAETAEPRYSLLRSLREYWSPRPSPSNIDNVKEVYQMEYEKAKYDKVERFEPGIPRLAALLSSHENYGVYRGYFPYASRILLQHIIDLGLLADKLDQLDAADAAVPDQTKLKSVILDPEADADKIKLLKDMEIKLTEYYSFLTSYTNVRALAPAPPHSQRSVQNWMIANRPLVQGQDDFIHHITDLVSATKKYEPDGLRGSPIETFIENRAINNEKSLLNYLLTTTDDRNKSTNPLVHMYSHSPLATLTRVIAVALAVGFLLIPVFILFLVAMSRAAMVLTVFAFVLAFSVMISLVSGARTQDLLIGTAAYGAFVVTFLGNMNQGFAPGVQ